MNPHAKEFVPAHLLKRRQEEEGNELAEKVGQVGLEDSKTKSEVGVTSQTGGDSTTVTNEKTTTSTATTTTTANNNHTTIEAKSSNDDQSSEQQQHNQHSNHSNDKHHNNINGDKHDLEGEEDRHLLKAGETYCEFNGEQFIIPGEDDEYEPDYPEQPGRKAGYDFGNAEDNEDEDVCNAYEQFLDNLPE